MSNILLLLASLALTALIVAAVATALYSLIRK